MRITTLLLALASVLAAAPAASQDQPTACPEKPADQEIARNLAGSFFSSAERSFKEKRFDDALAKFVCSLRMMDHENTLFNVAHVALFAENKQAALALFRAYVADHPKGRTSREMRKMITQLESEAGSQEPASEAPREEAPPAPEPAEEEQAPTGAAAPAPEPKAAGAPEAAEGGKPGGPMARYLKIGGWTGVGAGAAALVIGAVLQGVSAAARQDALDARDYGKFVDERDRSSSLQAGAIAGFVIGGVLGGAGAFLLLWDFKPRAEGKSAPGTEKGLELSVVPGASGLLVKGRF